MLIYSTRVIISQSLDGKKSLNVINQFYETEELHASRDLQFPDPCFKQRKSWLQPTFEEIMIKIIFNYKNSKELNAAYQENNNELLLFSDVPTEEEKLKCATCPGDKRLPTGQGNHVPLMCLKTKTPPPQPLRKIKSGDSWEGLRKGTQNWRRNRTESSVRLQRRDWERIGISDCCLFADWFTPTTIF
ncbi:hypothetical protein AVEN_75118-1 [Araneus ventricosus]|uniref:Uncharacterized protein n=1 Tax=Araneus ventricosus TaxID=182803 RepID=A0A4Y2QAV9_ARAVE|nr:hypothetical protein AVEN_75118-1 [Araneus ventricosus]